MFSGEDVGAQRRALGWSQQKLATEMGVDVRTVKNWERNGPPASRWPQLQRVFDRANRDAALSDAGLLVAEASLAQLVAEVQRRIAGL